MAYGWLRLLAAAVCLIALIHRMVWGMASHTIAGDNFFAYLTIQSNLAFLVVSAIAGVVALRTEQDPFWVTTARTLVLSWTITAGLAFGLIVWQAGLRGIPIWVPWSDVVLHFVLPAAAIVGWVIGPGRRRASWRTMFFVLLYPVIWGVFTMWRGTLIGWYPYYFLDPRQVSGILEMVLSCLVALAIFAAVAAALIGISRVHQTVPGNNRMPPRGPAGKRLRVPVWQRASARETPHTAGIGASRSGTAVGDPD